MGKNRHGAEEARRAHNPEDVGSKPTVGILSLYEDNNLILTFKSDWCKWQHVGHLRPKLQDQRLYSVLS